MATKLRRKRALAREARERAEALDRKHREQFEKLTLDRLQREALLPGPLGASRRATGDFVECARHYPRRQTLRARRGRLEAVVEPADRSGAIKHRRLEHAVCANDLVAAFREPRAQSLTLAAIDVVARVHPGEMLGNYCTRPLTYTEACELALAAPAITAAGLSLLARAISKHGQYARHDLLEEIVNHPLASIETFAAAALGREPEYNPALEWLAISDDPVAQMIARLATDGFEGTEAELIELARLVMT